MINMGPGAPETFKSRLNRNDTFSGCGFRGKP